MSHENYDLSFPDQPVVDLYLPTWAKLPAFRRKPAFIWTNDGDPPRSSSLTYAQLNSSVRRTASHLLTSLQRSDTVVILCEAGLRFVKIIFACQRAGLRAVPVIPPHPSFADRRRRDHLVRVLSQTTPNAAVACRSYINQVQDYTSSGDRLSGLLRRLNWIAVEEIETVAAAAAEEVEEEEIDVVSAYGGCKADEVYLVQYTSGATAIPKPVLVTAGAAAHNVRVARGAFDLHPNSVIVSWLPPYHDCGLMFLLLTVVSGATCVLASPTAFLSRPRLWLELITEYKATCTPVPSFALPLVVRRGGGGAAPIALGSMKNLIIINEPIYASPVDTFLQVFTPRGLDSSSISPSYGLAENCTFVSTAWRNRNSYNLDKFPVYNGLLPSAKLPCTWDEKTDEEIKILVVNEATCTPLDDGIEGEIWVSSPSNAKGYLNHPSLTQNVFNGRLKNHVTCCFIRTGDRGVVKGQERYLYVTGRRSDIIHLANGRELHPHYIETSAYNSCPNMLRPGCLAAVEVLGRVAIVGELQMVVGESKSLLSACMVIRDAVLREAGVEVGLVVLVRIGCMPKMTSGKIQRWAAKSGLERNEMSIVMRVEFGGDDKGKSEGNFHAKVNGENVTTLMSCL